MDYYAIGQRIRKVRKAVGMSQEQLAEKVGISTTHMSHIETGNTKLSLPVLVEIAKTLNTHTDDFLFAVPQDQIDTVQRDIYETLITCTPQQLKIISEIIQTTKTAMDKHL